MSLTKDQIKQIFTSPHLMQYVIKPEAVEQVVQAMSENRRSPVDCVRVAMYSKYADSILRGLHTRFQGTDNFAEFLSAVAHIHAELIGPRYPITWPLILDLLSSPTALEAIVYFDGISPSNPIQKRLNWDLYWEHKFLRFMKRKNFKRVWDTIKQARWGFYIQEALPEGKRPIDYDGCWQEEFRAFPASKILLTSMARRLFDAMAKAGDILPLNTNDPKPNWETLHTRVPGIWVADVLPYPEWHKTLIIAAHFSKTTNAKKRAKLMREIARV